jgi:hypothetical protein
MSQTDSMLLEIDGYTKNANIVKETVLERLQADKIITNEQAKEYAEKWQVIVIKKGWFERWMKAFNKDKADSDSYQFNYVRFED